MIEISKNEADYLIDHIQYVRIAMTGKKKKSNRKKRYVEEIPGVLDCLEEYRKLNTKKGK